MGDFDRNQAPKTKAQNKQVAIAIALGVLLIGVLGFHFMKQGPQTASAQTGGGNSAPTAFPQDDTPEQVGDRLLKNPYIGLLPDVEAADPQLKTVPENPFLMNAEWRDSITKAGPGTVVDPQPTHVGDPPPIKIKIPSPPVNLQSFKLSSIVRGSDGKYLAILNGQVVSAGSVIKGARVLEILTDRVILQHPDFADGPKSELLMSGGLNP